MREKHRRSLKWFATIFVGLSLALPIFFGAARKNDGSGGDPWRNTIFDFQTLIAGIFAIAAAYETVRQMQKSDAKSDKRHEELLRLNIRPDYLRVERLLLPQFHQLRTNYRLLRDREYAVPFTDDEKSMLANKLLHDRDNLIKWANEVGEILGRDIWHTTENLFDGELTYNLGVLKKSLDRLGFVLANGVTIKTSYSLDGDAIFAEVVTEHLFEVPASIDRVMRHLEPVFQGLHKLAKFYGIEGYY